MSASPDASDEASRAAVPRLAVVSDVNVERTGGGFLLLYRLLSDYPSDRLRVVHSSRYGEAKRERLLPAVQYAPVDYAVPRLFASYHNPLGPLMTASIMRRIVPRILDSLADFEPGAILTVVHGHMWLAAAEVARRLGLPLHLILHDDWGTLQTYGRPGLAGKGARWACERMLGRVYRSAASRLCVSPGMVSRYRTLFGVDGTLLYPSRGEDSPVAMPRLRASKSPPVVAFCGQIHQGGTWEALRRVAAIVGEWGGHLDLYTIIPPDRLTAGGLHPPVVRHMGFLPPVEMAEVLGKTAHVLFLPSSFDPREADDVATLFPSKLADYTAVGLPVLIWGPTYSSAARWALDNPGAAVLVSDSNPDAVRAPLARLTREPEFAAAVAKAGIAAGLRDFDATSARRTLRAALRQGEPRRARPANPANGANRRRA